MLPDDGFFTNYRPRYLNAEVQEQLIVRLAFSVIIISCHNLDAAFLSEISCDLQQLWKFDLKVRHEIFIGRDLKECHGLCNTII